MSRLIVVPWRSGCPHREKALEHVLPRLEALSDATVVMGILETGPWVKAKAVMSLIEHSTARTVAVVDADVLVHDLPEALDEVDSGRSWAVPHLHVRRLTQDATARVYAGADPWDHTLATTERPYVGVEGGGVVVARRDVLLEVPFDARFQGWGGEDHALGYALNTLYGAPWRGSRALIHLWHPPQARSTRKVGSQASEKLRRRYRDARTSVDDMRQLVGEARGLVQAEPQGRARASA